MSKTEQVHVVMLPWLAFGHMIPFLDLSVALARSNIRVSFISTPRNIQRLPKIPPNLSPLIDFVPLALPKLDLNLLPEDAESSMDIPADKMDNLKEACDLLQEPIKDFISSKPTNWIIVDFFQYWAVDIGRELNIPLVTFFITTASTATFAWTPEFLSGEDQQPRRLPKDLTAPPNWVDFPSQVFCGNHAAANHMHNVIYGVDATGISGGARFVRAVEGSRAVAIRTSVEIEGDYLKLFSEITKKPVFPLGFLPPGKLKEKRVINEESWGKIFDWLDGQKPRSVVFVSFGSEHKLTKEEIFEIAHGLQISGLPFLWALRKPDWADGMEFLPPGFVPRTEGRGVVHFGWAPQREILGHPSIGGSLFHSGWASVIETVIYGHCLVLLPFVITQPLDTRLLVEKGLAVEVERGEDGSFTRNEIANSLRKAMVSEEGEKIRVRIQEAADGIFGNKELNDSYIDKFMEYLKIGILQYELSLSLE